MYYIHQDHLGSYDVISSDSKTVVERQHFDPWGNRKNPANWNIPDTRTSFLFDRGFTGHEHLDAFAIINMNARLYAPVIGRFFSPDPYVQAPGPTQGFNRYTYCLNNPLSYVDPSGEIAWFVPVIIGAVIGTYTGGVSANDGNFNPGKWDWGSGKTWGYMLGGGIVGGLSGLAGGAIANIGMPMGNTLAIAGSSFISSVGTHIYTGGQSDISVSLGIASYNFSTNTWGYLGKKGNSALENMAYTFGAMANLTDAVSLFGKVGSYDINSATTKKGHEWWGHSSGTGEDINISDGPGANEHGSKLDYFKLVNGEVWENYANAPGTWSIELDNVNQSILQKMSTNIANGNNLLGAGSLKWNLVGYSCVNYTARSLWAVGIPTLPINVHPHILNFQLLIRQLGIYSSPYLYSKP